VKIAVSVPDELFERADELAGRLGVSRSQVYARALEEYLESHDSEHDPVTAKLNELAEQFEPATLTPAAGRRLVDSGQWEW
jgi:metal-responsive CopG/Arc/MetJ family transcriptional regulator